MTRYFIRIESERGNAADDGLEFPDLAAAHQHALVASAAIITEELARDEQSITLNVIITNEGGERVAKLRVETEVTDSPPPFDD
jgi:hypothetical protein